MRAHHQQRPAVLHFDSTPLRQLVDRSEFQIQDVADYTILFQVSISALLTSYPALRAGDALGEARVLEDAGAVSAAGLTCHVSRPRGRGRRATEVAIMTPPLAARVHAGLTPTMRAHHLQRLAVLHPDRNNTRSSG